MITWSSCVSIHTWHYLWCFVLELHEDFTAYSELNYDGLILIFNKLTYTVICIVLSLIFFNKLTCTVLCNARSASHCENILCNISYLMWCFNICLWKAHIMLYAVFVLLMLPSNALYQDTSRHIYLLCVTVVLVMMRNKLNTSRPTLKKRFFFYKYVLYQSVLLILA